MIESGRYGQVQFYDGTIKFLESAINLDDDVINVTIDSAYADTRVWFTTIIIFDSTSQYIETDPLIDFNSRFMSSLRSVCALS